MPAPIAGINNEAHLKSEHWRFRTGDSGQRFRTDEITPETPDAFDDVG
jgi:hypothetical protein